MRFAQRQCLTAERLWAIDKPTLSNLDTASNTPLTSSTMAPSVAAVGHAVASPLSQVPIREAAAHIPSHLVSELLHVFRRWSTFEQPCDMSCCVTRWDSTVQRVRPWSVLQWQHARIRIGLSGPVDLPNRIKKSHKHWFQQRSVVKFVFGQDVSKPHQRIQLQWRFASCMFTCIDQSEKS